MTNTSTSTRILRGDGNRHPYVVDNVGGLRIECQNILQVLEKCDQARITQLKFSHSGRYLTRRQDGWYETSDTEQCDKFYNLPPEGKKIK